MCSLPRCLSKAWVSCSCLSSPYCVRLCPRVPRRLPAVRICRNMVSSWRVYFQICYFRKLALNCGLEFCFSWFALGVGDLVLGMGTSGLAILGLFLFFLNLIYVLSFLCFSIKSCPPGDVLSLKALLTVFICSRFSFLKVLVFLVFLSSVTLFLVFSSTDLPPPSHLGSRRLRLWSRTFGPVWCLSGVLSLSAGFYFPFLFSENSSAWVRHFPVARFPKHLVQVVVLTPQSSLPC